MTRASKTFEGVTPEIWNFIREESRRKHDTVYDPPDADIGTATTSTIVGRLELSYQFDRGGNVVTFTIEQKPMLVPTSQIWDGIQKAIDSCAST